MTIGGLLIGEREIELMSRATITIFEVLERAWTSLGCSLIDMKVEFGVDEKTSKSLYFRGPRIWGGSERGLDSG